MADLAIETIDLEKSFGNRPALNGLNMHVPVGSIFGFLGRNGAGKTTTIKLLMGILRPDGGSARMFGVPSFRIAESAKVRQRIGFVTEDKELYPYMTIQQVIQFTRPFFPGWRDDLEQRYLRMFNLPLNKKVPDLSKGMRSQLMLLLALSRGAELLILDEPTDGLDPVTTEQVLRELVSFSAAQGATIFFSSHQLHEVEQIADQITIINNGRSVVSGSLDDLKLRYRRVDVIFQEEPRTPIQWLAGVEHVKQEGRTVSLFASTNLDALLRQAHGLHVTSVEVAPVTLQEIFLEHARDK